MTRGGLTISEKPDVPALSTRGVSLDDPDFESLHNQRLQYVQW